MVCKSDLVTFAGSVHYVVLSEVEEETTLVLVVYLAFNSISKIMREVKR